MRDIEGAKQVGVWLLGSAKIVYFLPPLARVDTFEISYFGLCNTSPCFFFFPCSQRCGRTCMVGRICWNERPLVAGVLAPLALRTSRVRPWDKPWSSFLAWCFPALSRQDFWKLSVSPRRCLGFPHTTSRWSKNNGQDMPWYFLSCHEQWQTF